LSRNLVVYKSVVGSCFNLKDCAYLHDWFDFILSSVIFVVGVIFGQNLLAQLKQSGEKLKGDISLLDYLTIPGIASSRKRDLHVRRTRK